MARPAMCSGDGALSGHPLAYLTGAENKWGATTSRRTVGRLHRSAGRRPDPPGDDVGGGRGLLSFRVDDDAEMIHVFAITWIG